MTECEKELQAIDERPLKDYPRYTIDRFGNVRSYKRKKPVMIKPRKQKGSIYAVNLKIGTATKSPIISRLMWETFCGPIPPGRCVAHRNGITSDNAITNLYLINKRALGLKTGGVSRRRAVIKTEPDGTATVYRSAREAGRCNYLSYQAINDRCNGYYLDKKGNRKRFRTKTAPDGNIYEWDD